MITLIANFSSSLLLGSLGSIFLGWTMFILSVFMILLVLVQRGKGGGLTGALGGPGGQSAFGSKAGDTFTVITAVSAIIWGLVCAIAMYTLGVPPAIADDEDFQFGDTPELVAPADPSGSTSGGLSGLSELLSDGDASDDDAKPETTGTPSADLVPAETTPEKSDEPATESATESDTDASGDTDAAKSESE